MSQFFPTVQPVPQRRLGFLMVEGEDTGGGYDYAYDPWGDYYGGDYGYDPYAGDYSYSFYGDSPTFPTFDPFAIPDLQAPTGSTPSANEDRYWFDWSQYLNDWLSGNILSIDTYGQYTGQTPYGSPNNYGGFPDWIPGPGPTSIDQPYDPAGDGTGLPGYCPQGQYHPLNDPYACVPFPPNDPNAKKQAQQQQKAAQNAANAAKKAQQQKDKTCPKDPQGRPVWFNPATNKCELVPQCPQGTTFDSATRRCLTPAQAKEIYGDNSWLWWLLGGGAVLLILTRNSGGRRK